MLSVGNGVKAYFNKTMNSYVNPLVIEVNIISNKLFGINLVLIKNSYGIFGVAVSIVISTLSGLLPANKAAKLDPVESLRRE